MRSSIEVQPCVSSPPVAALCIEFRLQLWSKFLSGGRHFLGLTNATANSLLRSHLWNDDPTTSDRLVGSLCNWCAISAQTTSWQETGAKRLFRWRWVTVDHEISSLKIRESSRAKPRSNWVRFGSTDVICRPGRRNSQRDLKNHDTALRGFPFSTKTVAALSHS